MMKLTFVWDLQTTSKLVLKLYAGPQCNFDQIRYDAERIPNFTVSKILHPIETSRVIKIAIG